MRTGQFRLSVLACRKVDWSTDPPKSFNMSYTKAGLESMSQEEFFSLAEKLEIPDYKKREKIDVIYDIIEKSVSESVANSANKEKTPRKRARVSVKNVDKVYTANQTDAKKVDKVERKIKDDGLFADLSEEDRRMLQDTIVPAEQPEQVVTEEVAPKKRASRKAAAKEETSVEENAPVDAEAPAPKKRGRKKKSETVTEENSAEVKPVDGDVTEETKDESGKDAQVTDANEIPEQQFNQSGGDLPTETIVIGKDSSSFRTSPTRKPGTTCSTACLPTITRRTINPLMLLIRNKTTCRSIQAKTCLSHVPITTSVTCSNVEVCWKSSTTMVSCAVQITTTCLRPTTSM